MKKNILIITILTMPLFSYGMEEDGLGCRLREWTMKKDSLPDKESLMRGIIALRKPGEVSEWFSENLAESMITDTLKFVHKIQFVRTLKLGQEAILRASSIPKEIARPLTGYKCYAHLLKIALKYGGDPNTKINLNFLNPRRTIIISALESARSTKNKTAIALLREYGACELSAALPDSQ